MAALDVTQSGVRISAGVMSQPSHAAKSSLLADF